MHLSNRWSIAVVTLVLLVLALLPIAGCDVSPADADLPAAYRNAVADARNAEPSEISRNLEAIVYYNPGLEWESRIEHEADSCHALFESVFCRKRR